MKPRFARGLPRAVWTLGVVSLLSDASSDMISPLLPLFITTALGGGAQALGWIEGCADLLSSLLKLVAGAWSDRVGRYRPLVIAGYGLSALAKPLVALASAPWHVLLVRSTDRTGKGLRTSPRDALIAHAVMPERRGEAFGLHRAMDHAGAVLGPLIAICLLTFVTTDLRTIFWIAAIPGLLGLAFLFRNVEEAVVEAAGGPIEPKATLGFQRPPRKMLRFLVPLAIFTLGNASDLFLLLKASGSNPSLVTLPLLWMGLHVVKALSSVYAGRLADRIGAARTISAGWLFYFLIYGGLAVVDDPAAIVALCLIYGVYHGLTEGTEKALVAELAPARERGAYFGWYHLTVGVLTLPASVMFGVLWDRYGSATAFGTGAALALLALALWLFAGDGNKPSSTRAPLEVA